MASKLVPAFVLAGLALGTGVAIWWVTQRPAEPIQQVQTEDYNPTKFFAMFDADGDKQVSRDEFRARYESADQPMRFTDLAGTPLDTAMAFDLWDKDNNGVIDDVDFGQHIDRSWEKFRDATAASGLTPKEYAGRWLALNGGQLLVHDREVGARNRGELPFGGAYFDQKYLQGAWSRVTDARGSHEGFLLDEGEKHWLLMTQGTLRVFSKGAVSVLALPEAPQNQYAREIGKTLFEDTAGNLALARRCRDWGMRREAEMLYGRVLVFERDQAEALEFMGLRLQGNEYVKRES